MKKYLHIASGVMGALAVTGALAQTAVCSGTAGNGTSIAGATTNFVQVSFTPKCSANVLLQYSQSTTAFAVGSGSQKGKTYFSGNTAGGGVSAQGACVATGCTATEVGTKTTAALTAAESS